MRRWILGLGAVLGMFAPASSGLAASNETPVYRPLIRHENEYVSIETPASARTRLEVVNTYPLDRDGTHLDSNFFFMPQVRLGMHAESRKQDWPVRLIFDYEHDLVTGTQDGAPANSIGDRLPNGVKSHDEIRRAFLRAIIPSAYLTVGGGYTLSHWGMGMLANDGAHGWTPGSAYFGDPRSGDRVIRATIGTVPLTDYNIVARAAFDDVVGDDVLLDGDSANQYIGSLLVGQGQPHNAGLYVVYRSQDSSYQNGFDVVVYDLTASTTWNLDNLGLLTVSGEWALINGHTTLAPTPDFPEHDLLQIGASARVSLNRGNHGAVFDFLFATGDENFDDKDQNAFKIDPNYEFGLLLFHQVMAGQTGRATVTAADPNLVGQPVPDLDRIPTGGSASNTVAFFPRAWYRTEQDLEVYGGPMFAISDVNYADPFNTRINGGDPHNALGGTPGSFYGTELDIGARYQTLLEGVELTLGLEGAVLVTGNAFKEIGPGTMGDVWGGRFMLEGRL